MCSVVVRRRAARTYIVFCLLYIGLYIGLLRMDLWDCTSDSVSQLDVG